MVIRELIKELSEKLGENGRFEAGCLLEQAGFSRITQLSEPNLNVPEDVLAWINALCERRMRGEPLQYLLGEREFYGFEFKVGEGVLIPRQDTETLVETAAGFLKKRSENERRTADLCAGSGCIGISLARLTGCEVSSVELSEKAFGFLEQNIALNGVSEKVTPMRGDVLSEETAASLPQFDLIVSNPPYLTEADMNSLQTEVTYEPAMALFGGSDGLDFYRGILRVWSKKLKQGGMLAVEIGMGQERDVMAVFRENGLSADTQKDACGKNRVVFGIKE